MVRLQRTGAQRGRGMGRWCVEKWRVRVSEQGGWAVCFTTARRFGQAAFHAAGNGNRGGANRFFESRLSRFSLGLDVWIAGGSDRMARLLNARRVGGRRLSRDGLFLDLMFGDATGQHVDSLLAHDNLTGSRGEDRHEADGAAIAIDPVPGQPDAVGRSEGRVASVIGELFGREGELAAWQFLRAIAIGVVVGVDEQLARNFDRLIRLIIKVETTTKPACRPLAQLGEHIG